MIDKKNQYPILITVVAALFFIPFLGHVHLFDWDEINFAESSREMIVTGDYSRVMVGFQPFWEKPPLFFWMQAVAMHVFGINEFSARLPNAIFGIITLLSLYYMGKRERNEQFGILWALSYFASLLPHLYFKSGIIDPVFNYFIFTGVYFLYRTMHEPINKLRRAIFAGGLIGLAVLTKGPVGLLIPLLSFISIIALYRFKLWPRLKDVLVFTFMILIVSSAWYGLEIIKNGPWFLVEFIKYQLELFSRPVADHQQPFYYHFVVVLVGCFPMSVYALGSFRKKCINDAFSSWMMTLFWVVMILFTIVTTKIVHYSSLAYLPLSFLAATYITYLIQEKQQVNRMLIWLYLFLGVLFGTLLTLLPLISSFKSMIIPLIDDPFAVAGIMKPVAWGGFEFIFGLLYLVAVIISFWFILKRLFFRAIVIMAAGTGALLFSYMVFVLPKVEAHTQGSLIDFLQSKKGEDAYVMTFGFYSYAPFFYFEQPNNNIDKRADKAFLLNGNIDKPVYIITKITDQSLIKRTDLELLKEEGGYRFYLRDNERE
jgi:4-amino-4-deoxy-L-arabinose transferase-like glycosyltransferase